MCRRKKHTAKLCTSRLMNSTRLLTLQSSREEEQKRQLQRSLCHNPGMHLSVFRVRLSSQKFVTIHIYIRKTHSGFLFMYLTGYSINGTKVRKYTPKPLPDERKKHRFPLFFFLTQETKVGLCTYEQRALARLFLDHICLLHMYYSFLLYRAAEWIIHNISFMRLFFSAYSYFSSYVERVRCAYYLLLGKLTKRSVWFV